MMSSPERGFTEMAGARLRSADRGQRGADRNRCTEVGLAGTIVGERALHFTTGIADTQRARGALRQGSRRVQHVATESGCRRRKPTADPFNRREQGRACKAAEGRRWRGPRRHLEDVLQRAAFLDMHGEVCRTLRERETRGRLRQRRTYSLQGVGRVPVLRARRSRRGDENADQAGNDAHAVRTIPGSVWPAQGVTHGVFA